MGRNSLAAFIAVCAAVPLSAGGGSADARTSSRPAVSVRATAVVESDGAAVDAVFALRLSRASVRRISVRFATADGSARAGADYRPSRGAVTFKPGQRSEKLRIRVFGDTVPEPEETFFLVLSRPRGATIKTRRATATIAASDLPEAFTLRADMTGAEYVPAPGDPTGRGTVVLVLDPVHEHISYSITVAGMAVGESGICRGARGEAPTAVLRLDYPPLGSGLKHLELAAILEMFRAPERFCALARVDFTTPGIRGQFVRASSRASRA